jgi:hypothetical protein
MVKEAIYNLNLSNRSSQNTSPFPFILNLSLDLCHQILTLMLSIVMNVILYTVTMQRTFPTSDVDEQIKIRLKKIGRKK